MSEIIYVEQDGTAYTVDQVHEMAVKYKTIIEGTFGARIKEVIRTMTAAWQAIKDAMAGFEEVVKNMTKAIGVWYEELTEIQEETENKEWDKETWKWQRIYHNRAAESVLKRKSKSQINFISRIGWQSSRNRPRRRGM